MNIAVFADLHGRLLLAFQLCARWQRETGEHIDLILQAGDLGRSLTRGGWTKLRASMLIGMRRSLAS
ncbi:hypothetical protein [Dictyobacter kobayashii]|uniref:Calcineurin-like phosphoesterase domain-containing protein n=1 Tax=Dictyobacter kobayashii TaxID=2014872 RepID=A0A402AQS7_9CHLR|nr:hypothetical protein [Dictyobacter kobayashii]GCE21451.1 hypothetical protein KDK_52510 [Dictyobacter kobayashii]